MNPIKCRYVGPLIIASLDGNRKMPLNNCEGVAWREVMPVDGILQTIFRPNGFADTEYNRYVVDPAHLTNIVK